MPRVILQEFPDYQRGYLAVLLLAVASLALSRVDILTMNGMALIMPHRPFILLSIGAFAIAVFSTGKLELDGLDLTIFSFLAVILTRLLTTSIQTKPLAQSMTIVAQLLLAIGFYVALSSYPFDRGERWALLRVWLIVVLLVSGYGFYQVFARNLGLPLAHIELGSFQTAEANLFGYQRPTSIFQEPTHYSAFVLPAYVFYSYLFLKGRSRDLFSSITRRLHSGLLGLLWLNYFLIGSLGGYIAVVATVAIAALVDHRVRRMGLVLGLSGVLLGAVVISLGPSAGWLYAPVFRIYHFLTSLLSLAIHGGEVSGSIGIRMTRLYWALEVWLENPLFGIGLNEIVHTNPVAPSWYVGRPLRPVTHSVVGFLLSSTGIFGAVSFGAIYVVGFRYVMWAVERLSSGDSSALVGLGFAILVNSFVGFFSLSVIHVQNWFLFALLSIFITAARTGDHVGTSGTEQT